MKCWDCKEYLMWQGDNTYDEYGIEGEGIVTNLSCPNCESFVLVYSPLGEKDEAETN